MSKTVLKYSYSQAKNGYIVSGYESIADSGEVIIPDRDVGEEGKLKVFGIGDRAFAGCNEITSIVIPNSITEIGEYIFEGCKNLVKAAINCNILTLKAGIFSGCTSLSMIDIPNSVTQIEEKAFQNCFAMESIIIPDRVESIGNSAFKDCTGLTSVTIPDSVESIGDDAFSGCSNLIIYCKVASKPDTWSEDWNPSGRSVIWGVIEDGITTDGLLWVRTSSNTIIIGYKTQPVLVNIPCKINDTLVSNIASNAFLNCNNITFRYFGPIDRFNDNYPYGAESATRVYLGMPYQDMDFLGFTFNGKHSYLDLGVLRIINDRIQHSLSPDMNDITADNPGGDGMYYFGSHHKSRKFSIDFAFDHLTEQQMREWKKFCSNKELSDLIFDEEPYKVYTAKITGAPILKTIPFEEDGQRIYKGEGTLEFTCYWPYAHTPDENTKVSEKFIVGGKFGADGKSLNNYLDFLHLNKDQWAATSGLQSLHNKGMNPGDIPTPFVYSLNETVANGTTITVGNLKITIGQNTYNLKWDSKTGIVSGTNSDGNETTRKPILYSGESLGGIPVGGTTAFPQTGTLTYHYWYY